MIFSVKKDPGGHLHQRAGLQLDRGTDHGDARFFHHRRCRPAGGAFISSMAHCLPPCGISCFFLPLATCRFTSSTRLAATSTLVADDVLLVPGLVRRNRPDELEIAAGQDVAVGDQVLLLLHEFPVPRQREERHGIGAGHRRVEFP